jgi:hypothetical protein
MELEKNSVWKAVLLSPEHLGWRGERGQLRDLQQYSGERTHRFRKQVKPELSGEVGRPTG